MRTRASASIARSTGILPALRRRGRNPASDRGRKRQQPAASSRPSILTLICILIATGISACGGSSGSTGGGSPPPAPDTFARTAGDLKWSSIGAAIAALSNGNLLIAGGYDGETEAVAAAELYRPGKETFKLTRSSLTMARNLATATALKDGTVLIAGGVDETGTALAAAEIYNPATRQFRSTAGAMSDARIGAAAALLPNGLVLIAGGLNANGQFLNTADLYNPVTGTFAASLGTMSEDRQYATATLLPNGLVLIAGGFGDLCANFTCQDADLYDPAGDAFSPSAGQMSEPRDGATATALSSGKVLIAGGQTDGETPTNSADIYDPASDTFTASQGTLSVARAWAVASSLPNGRVLIAGGLEADLPTGASASADLYDPATDSFAASTGQMSDARAYAVAASLTNGTVLIAGGLNKTGEVLSTADIYNP